MLVYALLVYTGDGYELDEIFETDSKAEDYAKEKGYDKAHYLVVEKEVIK